MLASLQNDASILNQINKCPSVTCQINAATNTPSRAFSGHLHKSEL